MAEKPTREQLPFYNRFMSLLNSEVFSRDIETLRNSKEDIRQPTYENVEIVEMSDGDDIVNEDETPPVLHQIMKKHNLPIVMEDFMYHYVQHKKINLGKLRNGVYLVDEKAMEASGNDEDKHMNFQAYVADTMEDKYVEVTLAFPLHATNTQIVDTIKQHKQFIKDKQTRANNNSSVKRVRSEYYAERDNAIMSLHEKGLPPRKIRPKLIQKWGHLTEPAISNIIYRRKKQRQNLSS